MRWGCSASALQKFSQGTSRVQSGIRFASRAFLFLFSCALVLCGAFAQTTTPSHSNTSTDYTHDVYPFLGVDWGGNTFVGAAVPFGAVKLGPDMENFDSRPSGFGYMSGGRILGFSHLHLSGASGKYGNILVAPVTGPLDITDIKSPRTEEVNHPGYYAAFLLDPDGINVEAVCHAPA